MTFMTFQSPVCVNNARSNSDMSSMTCACQDSDVKLRLCNFELKLEMMLNSFSFILSGSAETSVTYFLMFTSYIYLFFPALTDVHNKQ